MTWSIKWVQSRGVVLVVWCIAAANGMAWSILTPAFQVPDETAHFAYVQQIAENGTRPGELKRPEFSAEQAAVQEAIGTLSIIGRPTTGAAINVQSDQDANEAIGEAKESAPRDDGGGPSTAAAQPPLFYASSAAVYWAFSWASLPIRLQAIRTLAVLFFAFAAALITMTVLEFAPRERRAALVAGVAIALSPYCAFIACGVTPDSLLILVASLTLFLFARAFTEGEGFTVRRIATIGLVTGLGLLTKLTFIAFVPGIAIGVLLLVAREARSAAGGWLQSVRTLGVFAGSSLALPLCFVGWILVSGQPLRPASTAPAFLPAAAIPDGNARELLTYAWQLYLPRLSFMTDQFGFSAPYETWLRGFAGRYGWLDYGVSADFGRVVTTCFYSVGALGLVAIVRFRRVFAQRWREVVVASLCALGLCLLIAAAGYDYKRNTGLIFEQPRYLFPIATLYAGVVALAVCSLGRRAQPWLAAAFVALIASHNLSGIAMTIERYYG